MTIFIDVKISVDLASPGATLLVLEEEEVDVEKEETEDEEVDGFAASEPLWEAWLEESV